MVGAADMSDVMMQGRLEDEPLPGLLQQLHQNQATGSLRLETRVGRHEVHFRDGFPVAVHLPGSAEPLGRVMVEMGFIDEGTHRQTLTAPPPQGYRYGEWLIQQKLATSDQVKLALKAQVRRKLHRLFFLNEGRFSFSVGDHQLGIHDNESLRVHPARAIYQGVRSAWDADRLSGGLFLLDGKAVQCTLDDTGVTRYGFGPEEKQVVALLRQGFWALPDLVDGAGLAQQAVHAVLYALYITDSLTVRNANEVPRLRRKAEHSPLPSPTPTPSRSSPAFGIPTNPSMPTISNPLSPGTPQSVVRPSMLTPQSVRREVSGATPLPVGSESIRREIESKSKVVDKENLFQVLGVPQSAGREDIKAAYFEAAKRFHPDRLGTLGLTALRAEVEKIFRRVSEAYSTLTDDKRRADYVKSMSSSSVEDNKAHGKAMKLLEAEMSFRRGELLVRQNNFKQAIVELEAAVAGNPEEGEHLAYLTWARVCTQLISYADAKPKLIEATKLSPRCARAFFFLGMIYKEDKDIDRALASFKKAVEYDERLVEAEREIRVLNMRRDKGKSGIFDRFRKK